MEIGTQKEKQREKERMTKERAKERALDPRVKRFATDPIKASAITRSASLNIFATSVFRKGTMH